jgi:uncharacterized membrane protein YdjX (TVP38/TMEM64 family)
VLAGTGKDQASGTARRLLPAFAILALLAVAYWSGWFEHFSLSSIIRHREWLATLVDGHTASSIAIYLVLYAALVAISFPGASLLTIAAGMLFGGLLGGALTVAAATAGAVIIFLVARSSVGDFLEKRASGFVARLADGFRQDAFSYLLSLRLTPIFPFWVVNIVPAMLNMRLDHYALATFIGIIPGTFAYAFVGAGLSSVIAAQEAANPGCAQAGTCSINPQALVTPQLLLAMAALGIAALIPVAYRHWSGRAGKR